MKNNKAIVAVLLLDALLLVVAGIIRKSILLFTLAIVHLVIAIFWTRDRKSNSSKAQ